jgi:hypothetical protein
MSHGGYRPGAGRPRGSKSRRTIGSEQRVEAERRRQARNTRRVAAATAAAQTEAANGAGGDFQALENLRSIAKQFLDQAAAEESKEGGGDREFFNKCLERAARVLKDVVPFEAPKLVAVRVGGDEDNPLRIVDEIDLSVLSDDQLEALRSILLTLNGDQWAPKEEEICNGCNATVA